MGPDRQPLQTDGGARRDRLPGAAVAAIDTITALSAAATLVILLTGGFQARIGAVRVSAETPERPAIVMVALIALRVAIARRRGIFGSQRGTAWPAVKGSLRAGADDAVPPAVPGGRIRPAWIALAGYGAVAVFMLAPQLRQMHSVPDLGDPLFSMWRIGWVFHQLQGDPRGFFDANIFHPEPLSLTYSDSMLLAALTAAPLLAAGVPPVVTYNVLLVASFLASAMATYALVFRLTGSRGAAFVAGLFYGFHPYRFEHYSHLELQMTWPMPLALLALHEFMSNGRIRDVVAAGLLMVAQLYSSMYYGVFFALFATVVVLAYAALSRVKVVPLVAPTVGAALLAALLALPLALPYAEAQPIRRERPIEEVQTYSATASDYLRPHVRSATYGNHLLPPLYAERALFPGFIIVVLTLAALVPPIGFVRVAYAAGAIAAFDLSLGLNGFLYEPLHGLLPPLRSMRVAARFSIVFGLALAVFGGFGMRRVLTTFSRERHRRIALAVVIAAFLIDLWPSLRLQPVWTGPPSVYSAVAERDDVVLAEFPVRAWDSLSGWIDGMPQMYFSIWHGRDMVNGYSGFFPASYDRFLDSIAAFPGEETLTIFRARGVTHLAITCALTHHKPTCDGLIEKTEGSDAFRQVAASSWEGYPARLYEFVK